jgi:hypothetical protein
VSASRICLVPERLQAEKTQQLHTPQVTVVSLLARFVLGPDAGARLDRCRYQDCGEHWGEDGCRPRREADATLAELAERTQVLPLVPLLPPFTILAVVA